MRLNVNEEEDGGGCGPRARRDVHAGGSDFPGSFGSLEGSFSPESLPSPRRACVRACVCVSERESGDLQ